MSKAQRLTKKNNESACKTMGNAKGLTNIIRQMGCLRVPGHQMGYFSVQFCEPHAGHEMLALGTPWNTAQQSRCSGKSPRNPGLEHRNTKNTDKIRGREFLLSGWSCESWITSLAGGKRQDFRACPQVVEMVAPPLGHGHPLFPVCRDDKQRASCPVRCEKGRVQSRRDAISRFHSAAWKPCRESHERSSLRR
jgi:hypothetical protein